MVSYSAKLWWGKTLVNKLFQSFDKENVGEFTIVISYFSNLGKILANDIHFTKFTKVFPCQNFALYMVFHVTSTAVLLDSSNSTTSASSSC